MLVGTALAVIIPEGVRSLVQENIKGHENQTNVHQEEKDVLSVIGISLVLGFIFMLLVDQVCNHIDSLHKLSMTVFII